MKSMSDSFVWVIAAIASVAMLINLDYVYKLAVTNPYEVSTPSQYTKSDFVDREVETLTQAVKAVYSKVTSRDAKKVVKLVVTEAKKEGLDPKLVLAVIGTESSFQPNVKSWYGAKGYMQVVPKWHQDKIKGRDVLNPSTNIEVGVKVLSDCFKRKKTKRLALACYNGSNSEASAHRYFTKVTKTKSLLVASI